MNAPRNDNADLFPASLSPVAAASNTTPPIVTGQSAQALSLIRQYQPFLSFRATADFAIPEFAARVHDLRAMGYNVVTRIVPEIMFRGAIRRRAALYSMGVPEWPRPGFLIQSGAS